MSVTGGVSHGLFFVFVAVAVSSVLCNVLLFIVGVSGVHFFF